MVIALLTAAGTGVRMGQDIPKQFIHIDNKPIIVYTMEKFQNHNEVDAILVVTLPSWIAPLKAYAKQFSITKLRWVVAGGKTGQESIFNGLSILQKELKDDDIVIVHDGNRCAVSDEIISDSLRTFRKYGGAVAAIPCVEAIFKSDDNGVSSTVSIPRDQLVRTQTPHTYALGDYLWAYDEARKRNITNTVAPCTLMQLLGKTIYFSKGSEKNLKITTVDDFKIFESLLHEDKNTWLK